jgi:putative transposase
LKGRASVRQICAILAISRSWYYAAEDTAPSEADTLLRARIEQIVLEFPGYGYRRVTKTLQREGQDVNHKRVLRIMREESLLCQLKRRFVVTTDSRHEFGSYPNRIKGLVVTRLNQVWIADLTYVRLTRGFVYVAAILDWLSRKVIGWAMSRWIDAGLALEALDHALATRSVGIGLTHHSDHGVQYASAAYVSRLEEHGIAISMAAIGNPYENARAESFFKTLKTEEVYVKDYTDADDAENQIGHFLS